VVEAARLLRLEELIPELLIVGIGYPVGRFYDASAPRAVDLTPTEDREWERQEAEDFPEWPAPEGSGGAPAFLQFLRQELIPSIDADFRTVPGDRALFGHSFGGLFAVHVLLNGDGTFQRFIAGSPSLWWDDGVVFQHEAEFAATHRELPARVFFSIGELEEQDPDIYWGHMVSDLERFVEAVESRQYEGLEYESHVFQDETHTSVIPATISRGLRYIYPS
jgi:predicted alpha/beta superfamily hydrolase